MKDNKTNKKIIFITGTPRSGSTLLDLMLGNSSDGFSVGEIFSLFKPRYRNQLLKEGCFCDEEECNFWSEIKFQGEKNVYQNIFEKLKNKNFIVDSSKNALWIKDQFDYNRYNNYKLVPLIIYKSPAEFAYSYYKRGVLKYWKINWILTHLRLFYILDNFITIKYEDLAKNPGKKLKNICKNIDIDYFDGKEKFWNNNLDHFLFGSETTRNSNNLVYYEEQFDQEKLNYVKKNIDTNQKIVKQIMKVLNAYEVDSNVPIDSSIIDLKNNIKEFKIMDRLRMRLVKTNYYWMNRIMTRFEDIGKKCVGFFLE